MRFRVSHGRDGVAEAAAAVAELERLPPANAARPLASSRVLLGRMLNESGRARDAEPILAKAIGEFESLGPAHPQYAEARCELARARLLQGSTTADREPLDQCLRAYRTWGLAEPEVVAGLDALLAPDRGPARRR
jgi:hypothetical protein